MQPPKEPIRVFLLDDSKLILSVLSKALSIESDIEVVGSAADPVAALCLVADLQPDVLLLDVEMPRLDGLTFLSLMMKQCPLPVIIVSGFDRTAGQKASRAFQLGAVDVVHKPSGSFALSSMIGELASRIRVAARTNMRRRTAATAIDTARSRHSSNRVLAIGASTGGTVAIESILSRLPGNAPGTLIVQHMPSNFISSFVQRLNTVGPMLVREAEAGDVVAPGVALVAPANRHLTLLRHNGDLVVSLHCGPAVNHFRPSIDVLFASLAQYAGARAIGVLLTGMGADGAKGLLAVRNAGGITLAQSPESCAVYGMPGAAQKLGAAQESLDPEGIAQRIRQLNGEYREV